MSLLRPTYLTGSGADERGEGKLNHCTFFINEFIERKTMETFLLKHNSVILLFQCIMGVIEVVTFIVGSIWLLREIYLAERAKKTKNNEQTKNDKKADHDFSCDHLTPMECREVLLNNIEDGRFYVVSSLRNPDSIIVCAKRYDAEEQRLYCYAYLYRRGYDVYNLHVIYSCGTFKLRDFLCGKPLSIDFDRSPYLFVFEEENISPYLTERDYNDIVQSLQKAGVECEIEKSEENILGSYKCKLKVNKNKITNTTNK